MRRRWLSLLVVLGMTLPMSAAFANSAETIPEGVFALGFKWAYKTAFNRYGTKFGTKQVSIVKDYNFTLYDSDLFGGTPKQVLGRTDVTYKNRGMEATITAAYGITDNLSFMMIIPNQYVRNKYTAKLHDSEATLARDDNGTPYMIEFISPDNAATDTRKRVDGKDFLEVLSCRYESAVIGGRRIANPLCQYRYKPLRTTERWGVNDVIMGLRYKVMETKHWRQAITVFGKMATGRQVSTDDIFDTNFGDQQNDIGFWWQVDYMPVKWATFNVSFGYTDQLPEVKNKRVPTRTFYDDSSLREKGTIPIVPYWQKMNVHRDIGGNWDAYWGGSFEITPYLNYSNEFYFFWKYEDLFWADEPTHKGPNGQSWSPDFRAMSYGTNQSVIELNNSLGFSTIDWVMKGKFPVPLQFGVGYTVGIAGMNFEQTHSVFLSLTLIGSIFMFEGPMDNGEKKQEEIKGLALPKNAALLPEPDINDILARQEASRQKDLKRANEASNAWTNYNKMDW